MTKDTMLKLRLQGLLIPTLTILKLIDILNMNHERLLEDGWSLLITGNIQLISYSFKPIPN